MKALLQFGVLLLIAALPAFAQQNCPAPVTPVIQWTGLISGCTSAQGVCYAGEPITFRAVPSSGTPIYPACMQYDWEFGDGAPHSSSATPTHIFPLPYGEGFVTSVRVFSNAGAGFDQAFIKVIAATVTPKIDSFTCNRVRVSRGQAIHLAWSVRDAVSVELQPDSYKPALGVNTYDVKPAATKTFVLIAHGLNSNALSTPITVVVGARRRPARH